MVDKSRLTFSPSAMTVSINGVNIQTSTWNKTLSLLAQQATLRQGELTFGTFDNDGSLKAIHSITPTQSLNHLEKTPAHTPLPFKSATQSTPNQVTLEA